jgi:methanogenic corrinoid protein MtbC1
LKRQNSRGAPVLKHLMQKHQLMSAASKPAMISTSVIMKTQITQGRTCDDRLAEQYQRRFLRLGHRLRRQV